MRRQTWDRYGALVFGAVFTAMGLASASCAATTVTVDESTTHQTMDGFGASSMFFEQRLTGMSEPYRTEVYDLIFRDLGANILGIRPYHDFQPSEGAPYNWASMASQRAILSAAMSRGVINKVWVRISSPPGWMKDNGDYKNGGHVLPGYYDEFAAYCRDYVLGMRDTYGFDIWGVAIFNEPGHAHSYETTSTTPEEFRDILKVVGADFDANGLGAVKQIGPENPMSQITDDTLYGNYLAPIAADPVALGYLDYCTGHDYGDKAGNEDWALAKSEVAAVGRTLWQTEVCNLSSAQHNITGACWASWWAHRGMNLGDITAWHWWQYYWPEEASKDQGLIAIVSPTRYNVYPRYYMFKQWARNVPEGSVRVEAISNNADLHVTAFKVGSTLRIVATNYHYQTGARDTTATFNCTSISGNVRHIRTSGSENYVTQPEIVPLVNSFTVFIPALTVNTFIVPTDPSAPTADFSDVPTSGDASLTVAFTGCFGESPIAWD